MINELIRASFHYKAEVKRQRAEAFVEKVSKKPLLDNCACGM
jgi:hypothetical protein